MAQVEFSSDSTNERRGTRIAPAPEGRNAGVVPARYAYMFWGAVEWTVKTKELARYRSLRGVTVEETPSAPRLAGNGGSVKMTPEPGTTLLEVFLLTQAKFSYAKGE